MHGKTTPIRTMHVPTENVVERGGISCVEYRISQQAQSKMRRIFTIPDPHGDLVGFENSLRMGELVTADGQATELLNNENTVIQILGDVFGRGKNVLGVLQRIKEVRGKLIAGNHEAIMMYALLSATGDSFQSSWLQSEHLGARLKRELEKKKGPDVKPISELQKLFFEDADAFAPLLSPGTLKAARRESSTLAIHAGLDDIWMESFNEDGVHGMNKLFKQMCKRTEIKQLMSKGSHRAILWQHQHDHPEDVLSVENAKTLYEDGITMIVRGHDAQNAPSIVTFPSGLEMVNLDARISNFANRNLTEMPSGGCIMIEDENGKTVRFIPRGPDTLNGNAEALRP